MSKAAKRERQRQNRENARARELALAKRRQRTKAARNLIIVAVVVVLVALLINVLQGGKSKKKTTAIQRSFKSAPAMTIDPNKHYTATMTTSEGTITLALDAKAAPIATNNFVFLAKKRFYDGLTFHRISANFVIQGGDPKGDGSGGPGYTVKGEVPKDHYPLGALAVAKGGNEPAGTFGSQFFIVTGSNGATLPNDYARFGSVTGGLDVAQKIEKLVPVGQTAAGYDGPPSKTVTIKSVKITES